MSLRAKYERFLAAPTAEALSEKASINYITTLTTITEPVAILKHLVAQAKQLNKKVEKVIGAVEGQSGLCLDVETILEFLSGGGAYLPGLDDNFLADRTVTFPAVHIVQFDESQKIRSIRIYWDQGSLLKQIEVIGSRAKNWPIRDGRDQIRLVSSTAAASGEPSRPGTAASSEAPTRSSRGNSNVTRDPHASLSLFQPREQNQEVAYPKSVAPRASARPPPRDMSELFVGSDDEGEKAPPPQQVASPAKKNGIPAKSGAGKNFQPIRLFDEDDGPTPKKPSPEKANPKKYNHFEFGDGEEAPNAGRPTSSSRSQHQSQWDFEDFVTPHKKQPKVRGQDVRHFGWSDDEAEHSPVRRPIVHQPRPDSEAHFEFVDDGTPAEKKTRPSTKGALHNKGLGLYKDHVVDNDHDDDDDTPGAKKKPLSSVTTNVNNDGRRKDFAAHWEMADDSPSAARSDAPAAAAAAAPTSGGDAQAKISEDRKKVVKGMDANWGLYEQSPDQRKENVPRAQRGIITAGNGMGGRKGQARSWDFGDEEDEAREAQERRQPGSKAAAAAAGTGKDKSFWDF